MNANNPRGGFYIKLNRKSETVPPSKIKESPSGLFFIVTFCRAILLYAKPIKYTLEILYVRTSESANYNFKKNFILSSIGASNNFEIFLIMDSTPDLDCLTKRICVTAQSINVSFCRLCLSVSIISSPKDEILISAFFNNNDLSQIKIQMIIIFGICIYLLLVKKANPIYVMVLAGILNVSQFYLLSYIL